MIIYVLIVVLLVFIGAKPHLKGIYEDYLGKNSTDAVRGFFILIILAYHIISYMESLTLPLDLDFKTFRIFVGQSVVTLFLYYSGYGVTLNADKKGDEYIRSMPSKRILPTLLVYSCSTLPYLVISLWRGENYTLLQFFQGMIGWINFGNTNWYIFAIIVLYTLTWLVLRSMPVGKASAMAVTACTLGATLAFICAGKDVWWYNTLMCYPLGMWHYIYKDKIDAFMRKNILYIAAAVCSVVLYLEFHKHWNDNLGYYIITSMLFSVCVVLFTMKVEIRNPILIYCGQHLQGIFLVHRLPMTLLQKYFDVSGKSYEHYIYFAVSLVFVFLIDAVFTKCMCCMGLMKSKKTNVKPS